MCLANIVIALHRRRIRLIRSSPYWATKLCRLAWRPDVNTTRKQNTQFTSAVKFASLLTTSGREWYHTAWRSSATDTVRWQAPLPPYPPLPPPRRDCPSPPLPFTFFLISRYCICSTQRPYCIIEIYTMSLQCCHWSMLLCYTHKNGFDLRGKYRVYFLLTQASFTLYFCDLCRLLGRL